MNSTKLGLMGLLIFGLLAASSFGQSEKFSALGYLPNGAGMRMVGAGSTFSVDLYIYKYSSNEEAKSLAGLLLESGSDALHKRLEDMKSIGKITLTGRVGFYDLKFIRSHKTHAGRQIIAVTDRPIGGLEARNSGRSRDYNFGVLTLTLKPNKKGRERGEGSLVYSAKVKVLNGKTVEIENYGISPVQLRNVRKW
jgi:hypothetical protein